ncbi:chromate resistance protein [Streptomyces phaeochromogenes]|uniref:chromate resistance protein ChrB domain-containing protein n=1 Tax=Streptomyces phaeochromogenes TaxID=1923 RepID=UPI002E2A5019|nr:chromate resistance protein ChrB domain-containing protein [Streptomyces phaeochromogenes]
MRWVTRTDVHLDRVASPWLILRFIDPEAEFVFIDPDGPWPTDAVSFAMPGAEIGIHDEDGTTFDKLLARYELTDPVLLDIADGVRAGVHQVLGGDLGDLSAESVSLGFGLLALAEGTMLRHPSDQRNLDHSMEIYDALYAYFWGRQRDPRTGAATFWDRIAELRSAWPDNVPGTGRSRSPHVDR